MKKNLILAFLISLSVFADAQTDTMQFSSFSQKFSLNNAIKQKNPYRTTYFGEPLDSITALRRKRAILYTNIAGYSGAMSGLWTWWYSNYKHTCFHFFNDVPENLQMDKVSHAWGAYFEGRLSMNMWRWAGLSDNKAIWFGGLSGLAYEMIIETLDGFSSEWGWSWGDIGGNVIGASLLMSQELGWHDQRISLKYSTHINDYHNDSLNKRINQISGTNFSRRLFEDYNAQTYWLSFNVKSFFPQANVPKWFNVAAGYGAANMYGERDNVQYDKTGKIIFDARNIPRYRKWFIAPDVDFTRIPTHNKWVHYACIALNTLKFPTPSVEFSQNKVRWNWLHF